MTYVIMCSDETDMIKRANSTEYESSSEAVKEARKLDDSGFFKSTWVEPIVDYSDWDIDDTRYNIIGHDY